METTETNPIDKSSWGDGPWQSEPDRADFTHQGFACFALRHPIHGNWCGYVGVPMAHPAYGKKYEDVDVEVHGGLTYSAKCEGRICHVPEPGMPDEVWWLGFDCGHCMDLSPGLDAQLRGLPGGVWRQEILREVYRDLPYVRAEIERLAEQLSAQTVQ